MPHEKLFHESEVFHNFIGSSQIFDSLEELMYVRIKFKAHLNWLCEYSEQQTSWSTPALRFHVFTCMVLAKTQVTLKSSEIKL